MSIHGVCFDTGQSGNCGLDCSQFMDGDCTSASEFIDELEKMDSKDRDEIIEDYELFTLYPGVFDYFLVETTEDKINRMYNQLKQEVENEQGKRS